MMILAVDLLSLKVPLHTAFKTAIREVTHIHDIVVRIKCSDGTVGFGSAPSTALITGDDHGSIKAALENVLIPLVLNQSLSDFDTLIRLLHQTENAGSNAKAAMDIALHDAYARYTKLSLYQLISRYYPQSKPNCKVDLTLQTDYTISVNKVEQMCSDIDNAIARGFRCLKIKIGSQPLLDLKRLKLIYAHIQGRQNQDIQLALRLDVNQGWDRQTTISIMQQLEQSSILFELVEQPLIADDITGLAAIKRAVNTPIMADESAFNLKQVMHLHALDAVDIINIKLMKAGGLYPAMQIADYCRKHQLSCMIGCMLESSIGVAAAAHLAVAYADIMSLIDLDGPALGQYDPIVGATLFNNAEIIVNSTPGLGISAQQNLPLWRES